MRTYVTQRNATALHPQCASSLAGWFRQAALCAAASLACCQITTTALAASLTPYLVKDTVPGSGTGTRSLSALNGILLFSSFEDDEDPGVLWRSDGTEAGTVRVREDGPSGVLKHQTVSDGKLFFLAEGINGDGIGEELWVSDGTEEGTHLVKDIHPGASALPDNLTDVNGTLFFRARDGVHGFELWKTDGTEGGTMMVKDMNPGTEELPSGDNSNPSQLVNLNGTLIFGANDGSGGFFDQLWKSDGTEAGTVIVKDISPQSSGLVIHNDTLIFPAFTSSKGIELWRTDGTETGTVMIKEINPSGSGSPSFLTRIENTVYFGADDGTNGTELWKTDGTELGTTLVKDINPGGDSEPELITDVGNSVFFWADDGTHGTELWKSDGTEAGTQMVLDLVPGSGSTGFNSSELAAVNDLLFFTALVPGTVRNNSVLYVTDGTAAGTKPVFTIQDHSSSSIQITDLEFTGTHLFFRAPLEISPDTGARSNYELFAVQIIPEPGTTWLLVLGGITLALQHLRRRIELMPNTSGW